jgi:hypothetical protein
VLLIGKNDLLPGPTVRSHTKPCQHDDGNQKDDGDGGGGVNGGDGGDGDDDKMTHQHTPVELPATAAPPLID